MTESRFRLERREPASGGDCALAVSGEVDLSNAAELGAALEDARGATEGDLRVDCAGLEFIDSSGLTALAEVRNRLEPEGRKLVLVNLRESQRQVFELTGLDQAIVLE